MIVVQPEGGLCNRMRAIAGAHELAMRLKTSLLVVWCRDEALNCRFDVLFEDIPHRVIECSRSAVVFKLISLIRKLFFRYVGDSELMANGWRGNEIWLESLHGKNIYLDVCQNVTETMDFSLFRINRNIEGIIPEINKDVIGIHIRRADNEMSIKYSPTYLFDAMVEREISVRPHQKFYLATDDPQQERYFIEKYPSNIITYKKRSLDRSDSVAIMDAMVDLYHLSHCGKIYGSYYSSFSDVAAWWGKIEKCVLKVEA